jgi:hypothetical protein
MQQVLSIFLNTRFQWLFAIIIFSSSCSTAYYIPAYKQLPSYENAGDINAAVMVDQGYVARGFGAFSNIALSDRFYTGYQYNKHFDYDLRPFPFESNYHEAIIGWYKNTEPKALMPLDTSYLKASTTYGFHLGYAYQDWKSEPTGMNNVFFSKKTMTFSKYFAQFSVGSKSRFYEGNFVVYAAWFDLQKLNHVVNTNFSPISNGIPIIQADEAIQKEREAFKKAKANYIYGICYSGSILIRDFRLLFNLNSPNSLLAILRGPYLDFESANVFVGLQYQFKTGKGKRRITTYKANK